MKNRVHLVISNFNGYPEKLMNIGDNWTLYDQSSDGKILSLLQELNDPRIIFCGKTLGHNLVNYLDFIISNYENLPDVVAFVKDNIVGRHCTEDWLNQALEEAHYEFLYFDQNLIEKDNVQHQLYPSKYIEINNSWFAFLSPHKYFTNLNDWLNFIYEDYRPSKFIQFSPGGCYIVEKWRVLRNPLSLYQGLKTLISYDFRTTEAFFLERSLNLLFDSKYKLRSYTKNTSEFIQEISSLPNLLELTEPSTKSLSRKIRFGLSKVIAPKN